MEVEVDSYNKTIKSVTISHLIACSTFERINLFVHLGMSRDAQSLTAPVGVTAPSPTTTTSARDLSLRFSTSSHLIPRGVILRVQPPSVRPSGDGGWCIGMKCGSKCAGNFAGLLSK